MEAHPPDGTKFGSDLIGEQTAPAQGSGLDTGNALFAPGDVIAGRFTVVRYIASGGMGEVYEVEDRLLQGVHVALKTILPAIASDGESTRRFEQEVLLARKVVHPNLCPIYDIAHADESSRGCLFLTMKLLSGETLSARLKREPRISGAEAMAIFRQVVAGVSAIHAAGVIHRDLKPNNLMLDYPGGGGEVWVSIMDFGLARVHEADESSETMTMVAGTPGYIAPEMLRGGAPSRATDLFALGVLMGKVLARVEPGPRAPGQAAGYSARTKVPGAIRHAAAELVAEDPKRRLVAFDELQAAFEGGKSIRTWRGRAEIFWGVVGLFGLIAVAALLLVIPSIGDRVRGMVFASNEKHIAVLPLDSTGGTAETQAIGDGLMDSLAGKLSNLDTENESLWVIPASELRGRKVTNPSSALREFGATIVVKASFERTQAGATLKVSLIDSKKLKQIGYFEVENEDGNITELQDQAIARLVRQMNIRLKTDPVSARNGTTERAAYEDYLAGLGYFERSDKPENLDRAIEALRSALKTDPQFALSYALISRVYLLKYSMDANPKWLELAKVSSRMGAELPNQVPATYVALAQYHHVTGNDDLAISEYQRALSMDSRNAEAIQGIAQLSASQGRLREAEAAYKRAAALYPEDWKGWNDLGEFYDTSGRPRDAIAEYKHAIELTPDNSWPYSNLGLAYQNLDDPRALGLAEEAFRHSLALNRNYATFSNLGLLYLEEHRYQEAVDAQKMALSMNDQSTDVWGNLAYAYQWMHAEEEARNAKSRQLALLQQAIKVNPRNSAAQATLAFLYAADGRREKSMAATDISLALSANDPYVLWQVADAYESLGERKQAIFYLERAFTRGLSHWQASIDPNLQKVVSDPKFKYPAGIAFPA